MALDTSRIRGLCFDIDGTLSDSDNVMTGRLSRALSPFEWLLFGRKPQIVARRIVMGIESPGNWLMGLPDHIGIDDRLAFMVDFVRRRRKKRLTTYLLVEGIKEMLERLCSAYPLAVVSARDEASAMAFLMQFELLSFFPHVVTAQTCQHTKPYPDPILWAAGQMKVSPSELVMIGDTTVDIRAGKAAGAQTIGVLCGFGEEKELIRAGADLILPSTALLPEALGLKGL